MLLERFAEQAIRAHSGIHMDPQRVGKRVIEEHAIELQEYLDQISNEAAKWGKDSGDDEANFQEVYEKYFAAWLSAKSNCISSFITGGSNFPVQRAQKANDREHAAYQKFMEVVDKVKSRIIKSYQPPVTIDSTLAKAQNELAQRVKNQEMMKTANKIIRASKGADCTEKLMKLGLIFPVAQELQKPGHCCAYGFATFELTNNLANIKRLEQRVKELQQKVDNRNSGVKNEIESSWFKVEENGELDRIMFYFEGKPATEVIALMKKNAFKWSPTNKAWQRKITGNAQWATKRLIKELNTIKL